MDKLLKEKNYLSIVIVLSKRTQNISQFIDVLLSFCVEKFTAYEFVFVDNDTSDKNINLIKSIFTNSEYQSSIITLPYEVDKEQAVLAGVDSSVGDFIFEFEDADLNFSQDHLWEMYQSCLLGNDVVFLKPNQKQSLFSQVFYKLLNKYANKNSLIYSSTVHLVSRRAVNRVNSLHNIIFYRKHAYCNAGLNFKYILYEPVKDIKKEKISLGRIDYATDLLLIFTSIGKHTAVGLSLFFMFISFLALCYTVIIYFFYSVVLGWSTIMIFMSVSFAGLFLCLAIIIKCLNILMMSQLKNSNISFGKERI